MTLEVCEWLSEVGKCVEGTTEEAWGAIERCMGPRNAGLLPICIRPASNRN